MRIWFGKYKDRDFSELPLDYLCWLSENITQARLSRIVEDELQRRQRHYQEEREQREQEWREKMREQRRKLGGKSKIDSGLATEIIEAGFKTLAKKFHPDLGGDLKRMQELNSVVEKLRAEFS
jgi:hypothetical protein